MEKLLRCSGFAGLAMLASALWLAAPTALGSDEFAEDPDGRPAMATSGDPDAISVGAEDPDAMETHSRDPDGLEVGSEDPDTMVTRSRDPDDQRGRSEDPDGLETGSYELDDLPAARDDTPAPQRPRPSSFAPPAGHGWAAELSEASADLRRAEGRLAEANAAYSRALTSGYPRGSARAAIVAERDAATRAVSEARARLSSLGESARADGMSIEQIETYTGSP